MQADQFVFAQSRRVTHALRYADEQVVSVHSDVRGGHNCATVLQIVLGLHDIPSSFSLVVVQQHQSVAEQETASVLKEGKHPLKVLLTFSVREFLSPVQELRDMETVL